MLGIQHGHLQADLRECLATMKAGCKFFDFDNWMSCTDSRIHITGTNARENMPQATPADVARMSKQSNTIAETEFAKQAHLINPDVKAVVESIGLGVEDQLDTWRNQCGADVVQLWLTHATRPADLVRSWLSIKHEPLPALAALAIEARLSLLGAEVGSYFRSSGSSYADAITDARWSVAESLRSHVYSVRFDAPIILVRAIELTAAAYEALSPFADDSNPRRTLARIKRQVGRLVVTAARFSAGEVDKLEAALTHLVSVSTADPQDISSAVHRIEASLELYHATGTRDFLSDAARFIETRDVPENDWPTWHLIVAEIWLNLADHASPTARTAFLNRADSAFAALDSQNLDFAHKIRCAMFKALRKFVGKRPSQKSTMRGVRLPFALRSPRDLPDIVYEATSELISALRPSAERGKYQYREFLAELQSRVARTKDPLKAIPLLRDAIRLRRPVGLKQALAGKRDLLAQAQDLLLLASLTDEPALRIEGLRILLQQHARHQSSSEPLVLIAKEIETRGPSSVTDSATPNNLTDAIHSGNYTAIFAIAAAQALNNPGLRVSGLGGRGETYTVDDFSGITGETFVFKRTTKDALARDKERATLLSTRLGESDEGASYGVIEHIGGITEEPAPILDGTSSLISVRRYVRGRTLRAALSEIDADPVSLLGKAARFLGLIHGLEAENISSAASPRNQIKEKELGRWLKKLAGEDKLRLFNAWWEIVAPLPSLPRRDAHSLNWLVDDDQRVLAVDLEATGSRPATYELAQLIDDYPVLAPSDWVARKELLGQYLRAAALDYAPLHLLAYQASTAARAVGLLTDAKSSELQRNHGYELLAELSNVGQASALRDWCTEILDAWAVKTGLADPTRFRSIQPDDRVRISKAMSYHLRHDPAAQTTRGGWMFVEDLAETLQAHGHNVTPEQLLVVAGALGEPRFQLDGQEVRAAYGHSIERRADYETPTPPEWLYHASPESNMRSIFEAQAGLRPMGRQMVHLSTDPIRALQSAQRHSKAVLLLRVRGQDLADLVRAADDTWLVPYVAAGVLQVTTIVELARFELDAQLRPLNLQ